VSVSAPNSTVDTVTQSLIAVEKSDKTAVLTHLIKENDWFQVLVFSRTKHGANKLAKKLNDRGIEASAIHGNKSQGARTRALADFKANKCRVLVATDIAARGIDIDQLPHVVNFDLPQVAEDYIHRIGRTGRAGSTGEAVSLVSHDEFKMLSDIERLIKKKIPRQQLDGFEPLNNLPESKDDGRSDKPRKPHKQKQGSARRGNGGGNGGGSSRGNNSGNSRGNSGGNSRGANQTAANKPSHSGGRNKSDSGNQQDTASKEGGEGNTAKRSKKPHWNKKPDARIG
jgi:ATP-dependent RNA helicase RhlE